MKKIEKKFNLFPPTLCSLFLVCLFSFFTFHLKATAADMNPELVKKGKVTYMANCLACHHMDPRKNGTVGPALTGSSLELIRMRVLELKYPAGYTPKRKTRLMRPLPQLKDKIEALHAYINSFQ